MNEQEPKDKRTYSEKLTMLHGIILDAMELVDEMTKERTSRDLSTIHESIHRARGAAIWERWSLQEEADRENASAAANLPPDGV